MTILGGEGARVEEVTCPGDLWEMGYEEGLEGGQTGCRRLWERSIQDEALGQCHH